MKNINKKKRISIDFDRVIHKYSKGWHDGSIYDEPVEGSIDAIKKLQENNYEVVIFTTKSSLGQKRNQAIKRWLKKYDLDLKVTNIKLHSIAIIDDRAIRFENNWRSMLNYFI